MYQTIKTYGHNNGFSCTFRQHKAQSHCRHLHGYALAFTFVFESKDLDARNWVVDFGGMDTLKTELKFWFDHTTLVAQDDPLKSLFERMRNSDLIVMRELPATGCEYFARHVYELTMNWLKQEGYGERVKLISVRVAEHEANSALYLGAA